MQCVALLFDQALYHLYAAEKTPWYTCALIKYMYLL